VAFLPTLKDAQLDPEYPFAQGLRPARKGNVRLEREKRNGKSNIVHSYGHGGSGGVLALDVRWRWRRSWRAWLQKHKAGRLLRVKSILSHSQLLSPGLFIVAHCLIEAEKNLL
jgi:hypothetical protein